MAVFLPRGICSATMCRSIQKEPIAREDQQLKHHTVQPPRETPVSRRHSLVCCSTLLTAILMPPASRADDKSGDKKEDDKGVFGALKSLLDPNEKTKSGKLLPKAYLKSAREVVKNLRESLQEDLKDNAKFRRAADAAKESIRDYLSNWKGQQTVAKEESYLELEKVFRSLASFYSKAGPSAPLPDEIKSEIIHDLDATEEFL